jgi:hypothetical protein
MTNGGMTNDRMTRGAVYGGFYHEEGVLSTIVVGQLRAVVLQRGQARRNWNTPGVERLQPVHVLLHGHRRPDTSAQAGEQVGLT